MEPDVVSKRGRVAGGVAIGGVVAAAAPTPTEHSTEGGAELGGGHVVEDRVNRGVDIEHDAAEVEYVVETINAQPELILLRHRNDPQEEHTDGQ